MDDQGQRIEDYEKVKEAFLGHYKQLLGSKSSYPSNALPYVYELMSTDVPSSLLDSLALEVTHEEIKSTLFSLPDHKAPGPDGYSSHFFKKAWSIVGEDFLNAVMDFFENGNLTKSANATIIALVPKVPNPSKVTDFRPISCCSTIYKCISKIITNRLKCIMPLIISNTQAAFVKGRSISDQILLMHELVRNYHRANLSPRSALKIDLMKAFDSISWNLILDILQALQIPPSFRKWIEICITSTLFSLSMNGALEGYFKGAKGLRQGDPLSPYLFLLVMEFFTRLFNKHIQDGEFSFHPKCIDPCISHICFADDLFILCTPNVTSFQLIHEVLHEFHKYSGLMPNGRKSSIYMSGVGQEEQSSLCSILGFQKGELPVKYLGVPLISTKLKYDDCKVLIDRITKRVTSWVSKCLSYAGRLILVKSILFSIQIYWSLHFILPKKVCYSIEQVLRRFLWTGAEMKKWGSKVAWESVCLPRNEGGLGIKRVHEWNKAAMLRHLWSICSNGKSLWILWCKSNLLRGKCFWEARPPSDCSWNWKKILNLREEAMLLSKYRVGNGHSISLWFANWHPKGPLIPRYGQRIAYDAGLPKNAKVSSIIQGSQWHWPFPNTWELQEIVLDFSMDYLPSTTEEDKFIWVASKTQCYKASATWEAIRTRASKVSWHKLAWFPSHIPRHSFILWLALQDRLNTKDKLIKWGMIVDPKCALCDQFNESIHHLFFCCPFSQKIRSAILHKCSLSKPIQTWQEEVAWATGKFSGKNVCSRIRKLAWIAMIYHIWKERNSRVFKNNASTVSHVLNAIQYDVRVKISHLFNCNVTTEVMNFCNSWNIPFCMDDVTPGGMPP